MLTQESTGGSEAMQLRSQTHGRSGWQALREPTIGGWSRLLHRGRQTQFHRRRV